MGDYLLSVEDLENVETISKVIVGDGSPRQFDFRYLAMIILGLLMSKMTQMQLAIWTQRAQNLLDRINTFSRFYKRINILILVCLFYDF